MAYLHEQRLSGVASHVARLDADLVIIDIGRGAERAAALCALDALKHTLETLHVPVIDCSAVPSVLRVQARTLREYGVAVVSKFWLAGEHASPGSRRSPAPASTKALAAAVTCPPNDPPGEQRSSYVESMADDASPSAFAFVMATGILAHDANLLGAGLVASALLWIGIIGYVVLFAIAVARVVYSPGRVLGDLASQQRGPGFLALVAATGVLGVDIAPLNLYVSTALWLLEALLWLGLTYVFFAAVAAHEHKPRLTRGLSGRWLLAVVATQAVSLLGTLVGPQFNDDEPMVLFVSLSIFLSACVLYLALIPLILNRLEFLTLTPRAFTPDYWINMGAVAITTLTGSTLISASEQWSELQQLRPFLLGLTLLFWAGATWWIPLLILLEVWRHVLRHIRVTYATEYWSIVFPVAMYAACTFALAALLQLGFLSVFARWLAYVAIGLWLVAFAGLLRHLLSTIIVAARSRPTTRSQRGRAHRVV